MHAKRDPLGERMKNYENISRIYLTKRCPVIIRIDGKAFHTFTRGFNKPFDKLFMTAMQETAKRLCENITGCKLAYVQSDEISLLLTDYDTVDTQAWFDNNLQKLVSVSASMATLFFNREFDRLTLNVGEQFSRRPEAVKQLWGDLTQANLNAYNASSRKGATFDSRAFVLPKEEVCNYFIWRQQDATTNSILSVGQAYFTHSEMHGKKCNDLQDMLFTQKNVNWNDYPATEKRGSCIVRTEYEKNGAIRHEWTVDGEIPIFTKVKAYIEKYVL